MEKKITISIEEFETIYKGDSINLHDKLIEEFKLEHPELSVTESDGKASFEENNVTYTINIYSFHIEN